MVSAQPSTSTNSSSLNGIDMIVGDSIIMPSAISADATIRSMIRKGRKIRKPIWNAVFSSLVTKAGSRIEKGTSAGFSILGALAILANSARSALRVCLIMKPWSAVPDTSMASSRLICSLPIGLDRRAVDLAQHRLHHEQRQEQAEARPAPDWAGSVAGQAPGAGSTAR